MTANPERATAGAPFPIPGLEQVQVRLYPVVDHLADKVCATEATYGPDGGPSSRVRDLVDIITLARSEDIDGPALHAAIGSERARRGLADRQMFQIPETWRLAYRRQARRSPHCHGLEDFDDAFAFARAFVEPALNTEPPLRWSAREQAWASPRP